MPERGDVHVVPHEGNWRVEVEGMPLLPATYGTQAEARDAGREVARRTEAELLVHGRDGKIRERSSYGRDARSSTG
jgi:hypothetical protein